MRIAIAGIMHESNTFSSVPTELDAFKIEHGDELISRWREAHHEMGGFIEGVTREQFELVPILMADATPSGIVTVDAFDHLVGELATQLMEAQPLDGLLLALHGAMVSEEHPDADGEVIRRLRQVLGAEFPLVVAHDLHANISEQAVLHSTALVVYKTYPHIDQRQRGLQAAEILAKTLREEIHPIQRISKPPMVLNIVRQNTNVEPMKSIMETARDLERRPRVVAVSVALGYQYADVEEIGPATIVLTDGDEKLAKTEAERLSSMLWDIREQLTVGLPEAAEAVRQAIAGDGWPAILVEMGDNIGGGSAGDSTFLLRELVGQRAEGWVVVLADPEAVQRCASQGIGAVLTIRVGGKQDDLHGESVKVTGRVKCLHDGQFIETEPRHGGARYQDQGPTAVLELEAGAPEDANYIVLTTERQVPFSLQQLRSLGLQPESQKIIIVKAAIAYRAAYEPIAGRIIEVDTPGLTTVNPSRFTYRNVRDSLWGLKGENVE
ncbi:MAG: M81 family metallopeptidase [Anaerolineales bacterium]